MANNRAEAAYMNQHAAALYTLNELESIIENMPAPGGETRMDWSHVETMSEINYQLGHLLRFATGN
jgi:hypothetical protein